MQHFEERKAEVVANNEKQEKLMNNHRAKLDERLEKL